MKLKFVFLMLLASVMLSCRSGKLHKKGVDIGGAETEGEVSEILWNQLTINGADFKQVKLKSNVDAKLKSFSQKFPINIQVEKDAQIWASVTVGFELARIKMTPDSLYVLDRFNRTAYLGSWEDVSEITRYKFDFNMAQAMIMGNMIYPLNEQDKIESDNRNIYIYQNRDNGTLESKLDREILKIYEVTGKDNTGQLAQLNYKSFVNLNDKVMPTIIDLAIGEDKLSTIEIKHSNFEFIDSGLSFSFSIPSNYKIKRISDL